MQLISAQRTTDVERTEDESILNRATEIKRRLEEFNWHDVTSTFTSPFVLLVAAMNFCNGVMVFSLAFFLVNMSSFPSEGLLC